MVYFSRMRLALILALLIVLCISLSAQDGDFNLGARNSALAGASATIEDSWSIYNNIAGMAGISSSTAMISYQNRFGVSEFQVVGGAYVQKTNSFNVGVSFYRFGDELFNQQQMKFAVANTIDWVSLGLALDVVQASIESLGTTRSLVLEFGGIATITDQLKFSGHAYNINQAKLNEQETIPTVIKAGVLYQPVKSVMLIGEIQKDLDFDEVVKIGLEYEIVQSVWLRTGISTNPFKAAFGAGTKWKQFGLDYAFNDQTDLGSIHEFSLQYFLRKD